ncbi:hypothetical protein F4083_05795 [Candidatus Poribacteria bacterium]|nr:hypothetical protein [Candidatus Poribacteria bacterium]
MSLTFLNKAAIQELTNLLDRTPLPVVMKAFKEVNDDEIAVFLLLMDVASTESDSTDPEEIRRKLILIGENESEEDSEDTLTIYAQKIFAQFPFKKQVQIAEAISATEMIETEEAERIWNELKGKLNAILDSTLFFGNASKNLARLLGKVNIEQQNQLMDVLQENQPGLVDKVANHLYTFDDLSEMPDESIKTLIEVLETNTLALALYDSPTDIQDRFYENMSSEQAAVVETEIELLTHEQTQLSVTARQSIVNLIRNFAGKGLIKMR